MKSRKFPAGSIVWAIVFCSMCSLLVNDVWVASENNAFAIGLMDCLWSSQFSVRDGVQEKDRLVDCAWLNRVTLSNARSRGINSYLYGVGLIHAGKTEEAQQSLATGLDSNFRPELSCLLMGDLLTSKANLSLGARYWSKSGAVGIFLSRAQSLLATGNVEEAERYLGVLLEMSSSWNLYGSLERRRVREMTNLYEDIGNRYSEEAEFLKAVSAYQAVLQLSPNRHYMRVRLARIYRDQLDRPYSAIEQLERAVELADDKWQAIAYGELGHTYFLVGKTERATLALEKSIDIEPSLAMPHFYLGKVLQHKGNLPLACAEYRAALNIEPDAQQVKNLYDSLCNSLP